MQLSLDLIGNLGEGKHRGECLPHAWRSGLGTGLRRVNMGVEFKHEGTCGLSSSMKVSMGIEFKHEGQHVGRDGDDFMERASGRGRGRGGANVSFGAREAVGLVEQEHSGFRVGVGVRKRVDSGRLPNVCWAELPHRRPATLVSQCLPPPCAPLSPPSCPPMLACHPHPVSTLLPAHPCFSSLQHLLHRWHPW